MITYFPNAFPVWNNIALYALSSPLSPAPMFALGKQLLGLDGADASAAPAKRAPMSPRNGRVPQQGSPKVSRVKAMANAFEKNNATAAQPAKREIARPQRVPRAEANAASAPASASAAAASALGPWPLWARGCTGTPAKRAESRERQARETKI